MVMSLVGKGRINLRIEDGNNMLELLSLCAWTTPPHSSVGLHGDSKMPQVCLYLEHLLPTKCLINGWID